MKQLSKNMILSLFFIILVYADDMVVAEFPLHDIILNSNYTVVEQIDALKEILENKAVDINLKNRDGRTALNLAIFLKKDVKIIQFLIEQGANIDLPDLFNVTPLMNAIKFDQSLVAKILLYHGANRLYKNDNDQTAADLARTQDTRAILKMKN